MVFILSSNYDVTTDLVIDWLRNYNIPFKRINEDFVYKVDITLTDQSANFVIDGIDIKDIKVVWFRKHHSFGKFFNVKEISFKYSSEISNFLLSETGAIRNFLFDYLLANNSIKWVTNPKHIPINKIFAMLKASEFGLKIPSTYVYSKKKNLERHLKLSNALHIVKPVSDVAPIPINQYEQLLMLTTLLDEEKLAEIPEATIPSIVQNRIERKNEIRVFYIGGKFFSSIIFEETTEKIDHRFNLFDTKTRFEPYNLDINTQACIKNLLDYFQLNCASVDLILDKQGDLYFLEINPTGQFTYHSMPNNYYLEKEIAEYIKCLHDE